MQPSKEPIRHEIYYPEWIGETDPQMALAMLLEYEDAVCKADPVEGKKLFERFMDDTEIAEQVFGQFKQQINANEPGEIPVDDYVIFVLVDDVAIYFRNTANLIKASDTITVIHPPAQED